MPLTHLPSSLPLYVFVIALVGYCFGRLVLVWIANGSRRSKSRLRAFANIAIASDNGETDKPADERFELEKRAFFSKSWLFVCHQSKFCKAGDYHTFSFAGIQFFIVLGQDLKLRAFHNVCRHRAYTVVRKPCGTTKLFSCKYHGWQYDDTGALVKAPKFDLSSGFKPEENGLFEVKLLRTQEGLVRVNFDANTIGHPCRDMTSSLGMDDSTWIDGFDQETDMNWKVVAQEFASQAQWFQSSASWLPRLRKSKSVQMLGPLAMLREMGDEVWCTMKVLPENVHSTKVRCDFYARVGHVVRPEMVEKYKLTIEKEIIDLQLQRGAVAGPVDFSYEVGGRQIDLAAILSQHRRSEMLAKKKLQPQIRLGQDIEDMEAEALCNILDGRPPLRNGTLLESSKLLQTLEW